MNSLPRSRAFVASVVVALCALTAADALADIPFVHEQPRFELRLPSEQWLRRDAPTTGVLAVVVAPVADLTTRCSVVRLPKSHFPDGAASRAAEMKQAVGEGFVDLGQRDELLGERPTRRLDYSVHGFPTVEWFFEDGDRWVFLQLSAPAAAWDDPRQRAELEAIRDSFRWIGGADAPPVRFALTSPRAIREQRAAAAVEAARRYEVTRHRIEVRIEPEEGTLDLLDELELVALADDVTHVELYTSVVKVDEVTCDLPHVLEQRKLPNVDVLDLRFAQPLRKGQPVTLLVHASSEDYFQSFDQELVAEISVYGQVRPRSSWSTHVVWYPMDAKNDAAVDLTFDVPAPYVAVSGGDLVAQSERDGRRLYRYVEEQRVPRLVPFGFAVAEYVSTATKSAGGLSLEVFAWPGEEKRIAQRVDLLGKAAAAFELTLGPLPWDQVRFCHVTPEKKETSVSLPGLILVSDFYFPDLEGVDASDGNLGRPGVLGLLVIADELSHQWNIYAAGLPNELGEGVSTYTNALFVEELHGREAGRRVLATCRKGWIEETSDATEFAIADPAVYSNARYRTVVFCKTPVVLGALRDQLGDERFFAGFREGFARRERAQDGFDRFIDGFSAGAGVDLGPFFEQWFFRAGFPTIAVTQRPMVGGASVTVRQLQPEAPYTLELPIEFRGAAPPGAPAAAAPLHRERLLVNGRQQTYDVPVPFRPVAIIPDPDGITPARVERCSAPRRLGAQVGGEARLVERLVQLRAQSQRAAQRRVAGGVEEAHAAQRLVGIERRIVELACPQLRARELVEARCQRLLAIEPVPSRHRAIRFPQRARFVAAPRSLQHGRRVVAAAEQPPVVLA